MGCCVLCVCVLACLGEVLRVLLFGIVCGVSLIGFVDAFGFCSTVGGGRVSECLSEMGCESFGI